MADATIYDVAERAGVSITTVSRVLNTPARVQSATRQRVLEAIESLGFVPRADATARARKSIGRLGVLAPFFTYPSFTQRLRGIAGALMASPYELVIYNVDSADRRDAYLASLPISRRLDGLIIISLPLSEAALQRLARSQLPATLIEVGDSNFSSVEIDDEQGGRRAAEYLVGRGHRRIAFLGDSEVPPYSLHTSDRRLQGFAAALATAGIPLTERYIALAPHGLEAARNQAQQLLDLAEPPTAIFAPSDMQAMGALKAAADCGLRVPNDLAVIGFDDLDIAEYIGLTTVSQQLDESGRLAVTLLLERLRTPLLPTRRIVLPLSVVQRQTA
jgi:LacI family transcriptional regulator